MSDPSGIQQYQQGVQIRVLQQHVTALERQAEDIQRVLAELLVRVDLLEEDAGP